MFKLAKTCFPRSGVDTRNSGLVPLRGPRKKRLIALKLTDMLEKRGRFIVAGADNTLHVAMGSTLYSISLDDLRVKWKQARFKHPFKVAPLVLEDGSCVVASAGMHLVSVDGELLSQPRMKFGFALDDSALSPNVHPSGQLIVTGVTGEVVLVDSAGVQTTVGCFGYDVVPPAVYPDGDLLIAAYDSGYSLCRISPTGELRWTARDYLEDCDILPVLDANLRAAGTFGNRTIVLDANGVLVFAIPFGAILTAYPDGGWIARAKDRIARLDEDGSRIWEFASQGEIGWGSGQALVDAEGFVYALEEGRLVALTPDGELLFSHGLAKRSGGLAIVSEGVLACISGRRLLIVRG